MALLIAGLAAFAMLAGQRPMQPRRATRPSLPDGGVPQDAASGDSQVVRPPGARLSGTVVDEAGVAIAHARLTVRADDDSLIDAPAGAAAMPPAPEPPWLGESGDDGGFVFDTLVPGRPVRIEVAADGYETASRRAVLLRATTPPLRLVMRRTGTIAGVVRGPGAGPSGPGVAGATVVLAGSGVWPPRSVETDAAGAYRIAGVPGGVYEVRASRAELVAEPREGLDLLPGGSATVDLLLAQGATLHAVVLDADAEVPLAGAELIVAEDALAFSPRAARSSAVGEVSVVGLRALPHRCSVRAEGFVAMIALPCTPGDSPLRFALRRAATITGVVVDEQGAPIRGAQVEVTGSTDLGEPVALSSNALAFRTALFTAQLAGPTALLRQAGELGVTVGAVPPIPLAPTMLASAAPREPTPATGSDASVERAPGPLTTGFGTDAEGRFRITGVPPGRIQLVARHLAYAVAVTPPRVVTAGALIEDVRIVLPAGGVIDGRVTDARGFPVEAIRVELSAAREPYPRVLLAGTGGRFEFRGVVGVVTLTAYPPGAPPVRAQVEVASGATVPVTLALEGEVVALSGRVVDSRGFGVAGARVKVRSLRARTPMSLAVDSAEDGTWSLEGLPPPPYSVEADHPDYAVTQLPRVTDARAELRLTLAEGAAVRGLVTDAYSREPIAEVRVHLAAGARGFDATTLPDGTYEVLRVPAGRYTVTAEHGAYVSAQTEVVVARRGRALADADAPPLALEAGGSLSGEVVDALGAPISGAEVAVGATGDAPNWAKATRTDPQGRFTLRGVPAGDAWPSARHPAAGEVQARYSSRIRAGEETPGLVLHLPERFDEERGNARLAGQAAAGNGAAAPVE